MFLVARLAYINASKKIILGMILSFTVDKAIILPPAGVYMKGRF
jgi:hypothetical protein